MQSLLFQTEACRLPEYPSSWSPDRAYRYCLWRRWTDDPKPPFVQFIGLNPSVATDDTDDPTLRRCMGFSRSWGYSAMCMTNLFAFAATEPQDMKACPDPVGDETDRILATIASEAAIAIACWGIHGAHQNRDKAVLALFASLGRELHCLKLTNDGHPNHPLYLGADLKPQVFRPPPRSV